MKIIKNSFLVVISIFLFACGSSQQQNWTQFRGPESKGIAPEDARPPLELIPEENLLWKTPLENGVSSPCIFGDHIFITGYHPLDSLLITYDISMKNGNIRWSRIVYPDSLEKTHSIGSPASATPTTNREAVYVYFGSYGIICYDFEGNTIWEKRLPVLNTQYGTCGSPIIHKEMLIINRIGMTESSILTLSKNDGSKIWEETMGLAPGSILPISTSHSTPVIWNDQVIIHRMLQLCSFDINNGNSLWNTSIVSTGISTPIISVDTFFLNGFWNAGEPSLYDRLPDFNTMISSNDLNKNGFIELSEVSDTLAAFRRPELGLDLPYDLIMTHRRLLRWFFGYDDESLIGEDEWNSIRESCEKFLVEHGSIAIKITNEGDTVKADYIWKVTENTPEVPSLIKVGNQIYTIKNGGIITCIDARTGKIIFTDRIGAAGAYIASPLYANGHVYFPSFNGKITVIKPGDELDIVAQSDLKEKIAASPVALGNTLFIRTETGLYAFER